MLILGCVQGVLLSAICLHVYAFVDAGVVVGDLSACLCLCGRWCCCRRFVCVFMPVWMLVLLLAICLHVYACVDAGVAVGDLSTCLCLCGRWCCCRRFVCVFMPVWTLVFLFAWRSVSGMLEWK